MAPINNLETFDPREQTQDDAQLQNASAQQQPDALNEDVDNEYMQEGDLDEDEHQPDSDEL